MSPAGQGIGWESKIVSQCTVNLVGPKLIVYGGTLPAYRPLPGKPPYWSNSMFQFDVATKEWTQVDTGGIPLPCRSGHTSSLVEDQLFIFGGYHQRGKTNKLMIYDLALRSWRIAKTAGLKPPKAQGHRAVYFPERKALLVFGGFHNHAMLTNTLLRLSVEDFTWSVLHTKGTRPTPRSGVGATKSRLFWFVFGGTGPAGRTLNDLHLLDYRHAPPVWSKVRVESWVRPGMNLLMVGFDGKLVIFGRDYRNAQQNPGLYLLDLKSSRWHSPSMGRCSCSVDGPMPITHTVHAVVSTGRTVVCFGGTREESDMKSMFVLSELK